MNVLLITLGTSWAIVPEAFSLPEVSFDSVHVLTSDSVEVKNVTAWFRKNAPEVHLTITRVAGFTDLQTEEDHFHFEEVLYRWWIESVEACVPHALGASAALQGAVEDKQDTFSHKVYACLSGGFKTMSAAVQKAAAVFGADEVFHVLADSVYPLPSGGNRPANTDYEIAESLNRRQIHWVKLGAESGWPQLRQASSEDYPLKIETPDKEGVRRASTPDLRFRANLAQIVERSRHIAASWEEISEYPFTELATWQASDLEWLDAPLNPSTDQSWIANLPKIELHCHLGGFATSGIDLEAVRSAADAPGKVPRVLPMALPEEWPIPKRAIDLEPYRNLGDNNGSALLKDRGCLREQCRRLYNHLVSQNVVYAEIRCSPANYASPGHSPWNVLCDIKAFFDECMNKSVEACVPHGFGVAATLRDEAQSTQEPLSHQRLFIPFDKAAEYSQTWRNLPHRQQAGATAFVTFRLNDSLPSQRLKNWIRERDAFLRNNPKPWTQERWKQFENDFPRKLETWLDEGHGSCRLRDEIAVEILASALHHFDGDHYILDEFVIMPNHVHVIFKPLEGQNVTSVLHSWKSYTANKINEAIESTGSVWQTESFDHLIRNTSQLDKLRRYIKDNPKRAGLDKGYRLGCGLGLVDSPGTGDPTPEPCGTHAPTPPCKVNLIVIATRQTGGDFRAGIARHLALAVTAADHWRTDTGCRVVGVDLAGFEDKSTRAHYFREEFTAIHRCGLALTVHAGENDDAEGIWSAVFDLNARRLGHALHLADCPEILHSVAARGIAVEMCPYANYQIKGFHPMAGSPGYPLKKYLDAGVKVTVNTDNIGISSASLSENLLFLTKMCPDLTRMDVLKLLRNALDAAFLSPSDKNTILARIAPRLSGIFPRAEKKRIFYTPSETIYDRNTSR